MTIHIVQDESIIVIVAQIGVVGVTGVLAFFTWRLAHSTKRDVEAQWRPLLVPCFHETTPTSPWTGWAILADGTFGFSFQNVGKGPALRLQFLVADPPASTTDFVSSGPSRSTILPVKKKAVFQVENARLADNRIRVRADYADVAGNKHHTVAVCCHVPVDDSWAVESIEPEK